MKFFISMLIAGFILTAHETSGKALVTDATIQLQKNSTIHFELDNKIPVTYRMVPDSEIFLLTMSFHFGDAHLPPEQRPALGVMTQLMERGSKSYPREQLFSLLEKYATSISCGTGIELGNCVFSTLNPYVDELLPAFASVVLEPSFDVKETQIVLEQAIASESAAHQNPEAFVNEVVNDIFYGSKHPYWINQANKLKALSTIKRENLVALHQQLLSQVSKRIVVVGSQPLEELKAKLNKQFALLKTVPETSLSIPKPSYDAKNSYRIATRNIPTSYLRAKFVMPGIDSPDLLAAQLMMHILSEEFENEIRTKLSLSYSVYAQYIPYTMGIGVLHASTSRPQETLVAMRPIIQKLRDKKLGKDALERYKTVFATSYFLGLEEHARMASSLTSSMFYFKSSDKLYDMPRNLARVTPDDIQGVARKYLQQFRLGVVFKEKEFSPAWAEEFLKVFP